MRKIVVIATFFILLAGCGASDTELSPTETTSRAPSPSFTFTTDPAVLGPDLEAYLNDLGKIGALENEVVGLFDAVTGTNFTTNEQLQKQLELILPKANDFLQQLQTFKTKQPEIEHFHSQYVEIWTAQVEAFKAMDAAITNKDQTALQQAAANVEIARSKIGPLQKELQALSEYAGVQIVF